MKRPTLVLLAASIPWVGVVLLAVPLSARASEPPRPAVVRVLLTDGDTLHAARVRPASFDMVAVEIPHSKVRYLASNRVRAVLDSRGVDRTKAVLEHRPFHPPTNRSLVRISRAGGAYPH